MSLWQPTSANENGMNTEPTWNEGDEDYSTTGAGEQQLRTIKGREDNETQVNYTRSGKRGRRGRHDETSK